MREQPKHEGAFLTQEQVDCLPEGTRVVITWSGGNGPHEYAIFHSPYAEHVCAASTGATRACQPSYSPIDQADPIGFVGLDKPFTRVTVVDPRWIIEDREEAHTDLDTALHEYIDAYLDRHPRVLPKSLFAFRARPMIASLDVDVIAEDIVAQLDDVYAANENFTTEVTEPMQRSTERFINEMLALYRVTRHEKTDDDAKVIDTAQWVREHAPYLYQCPACHGSGGGPEKRLECPHCKGKGTLPLRFE